MRSEGVVPSIESLLGNLILWDIFNGFEGEERQVVNERVESSISDSSVFDLSRVCLNVK